MHDNEGGDNYKLSKKNIMSSNNSQRRIDGPKDKKVQMENRFANVADNKMSSQSKYRSQNLRKDDARQKSKGPKSLGAEKTKMSKYEEQLTPHSLKDENSKTGLILPKVKNQQKPTVLNASRAERLEALHRKINVNNSGIEYKTK